MQPKGRVLRDERSFDSPKEASAIQKKKMVGKIKIEGKDLNKEYGMTLITLI